MPKESILILDDNAENANDLCDFLTTQGYETFDAITLEDADIILQKETIDILVFDIAMDTQDFEKTSIELAIKANKQKARPTLFYTSYDQSEAPEFFNKTRLIKHSIWFNKNNANWMHNLLNNISMAKEFFKYYQLQEDDSVVLKIKYKNQFSFKEWRGKHVDRDENTAKRIFLRKDEILFITTDRTRPKFSEAFEPMGSYCIIFTPDLSEYYRFGAGIGSVSDQLERYCSIGYNFMRVHTSYIINVDYLKEFNTQDWTVTLRGLNFTIPVTETFLTDSKCIDLFPVLVSRQKD